MRFKTPILFIIFNKVDETKRVFNEIRKQKPTSFFIAADGPRVNIVGEKEKSDYIRNWVLENIDWDCEVKTLFREQNVGCGRGPSEAISWFFEHVEEGIILEDDCLPNETFFKFCNILLEKYRNNAKISIISGNNFQETQPMLIQDGYYFSVFPSSNGWATWKRSWNEYDYFISKWKNIDKKDFLTFLFKEKKYQLWWQRQFDWIYNTQPNDMWDFQFHFHCMARKQLAVIPRANLVKNIGYGPDATHSQNPDSYFANVPTYDLNFPLKHPTEIVRNFEADQFIQDMLFGQIEIVNNIKRIKRMVKHIIRYKN